MSDSKYFIKNIVFNNGFSVPVSPGDIIVFVGPNNAGKSQSLKDVFNLIGGSSTGKVVSSVAVEKVIDDNFNQWMASFAKVSCADVKNIQYNFLGADVYSSWLDSFKSGKSYDKYFRPVFFSFLNTENRLSLVSPPALLNPEEPRSHPIQIVKDNLATRKKLSDFFHRTFGYELSVSSETKNISLLLGAIHKFDRQGEKEIDELMDMFKEKQKNMPRLEEQGDGMRSFTGILLNLLMPNYSVFLIDEPESFLHPPQAKILGEILPEMIPMDKEAFIATHSQDLLKGLIEKAPERIKIIRITRDGNTNFVKLLDNNALSESWKDSFMKYSNILDALFHQSVVLCESDSDCKIYSMVLDEIMSSKGRTSNTLFIYCGGKRRFPIVAGMLNTLGVDFRIIPDLDFLNDAELVKSTFEICGGEWDAISSKYNDVKSGVQSLDKKFTLGELKGYIQKYIDSKTCPDNEEISKKELEAFKSGLRIPKGWDMVKHGGVGSIPNGNATKSFHFIDEDFKNKGIFMPHVGELENFFPSIGGHGPKWVESVIEQYATIPTNDKSRILGFISSLNL